MKRNLPHFALTALACLALAGCGGSKSASPHGNAYLGVFVSTNDCAKDTNLSFDLCADAINGAIETHNRKSPVYSSQRACDATEGEGKCERDINQKFRPRLIAYLVVAPKPSKKSKKLKKPEGIPLYATPKGESGFRDVDKTLYLDNDLTLQFSRQALAAIAKHSLLANNKKSMF